MSLTIEQLIDQVGLLGTDLLVELKRLNARLDTLAQERTGAASSVQLEQGAKEIRLTVKVYQDSPVGEIGDEALREFGRLFNEIEQRQANDWKDTVDVLNGGVKP